MTPTPTSAPADPAAELRAAVAHHYPRLHGWVRLYVVRAGAARRPQDVDTLTADVLSEMTRKALAGAANFDPGRDPLPWLMRIAVAALADLQRQQYRLRAVRQSDLADGVWDAAAAVLSAEAQADNRDAVRRLLDRLPPGDRRVLELRYLDGLDGPELARALGVSPGAARVRLHRALQAARARGES